jgi:moderate conductance mechanosensitive channel
LLRLTISATATVMLLRFWGIDVLDWFRQGEFGGRLASSCITLLVTLGVAVTLWETVNIAMQIYLDRLSREGVAVRAARLQTIVPLLRNSLLIVLMVLIALTALSEIGVNIGPLLAGASIFGVAIGFGSQKLVQDFITGIFLLLENAMQVGDTVTAGGLSGTVENLSIRTLRLRAGDGSVHVIPFSSVSTVTNANRGLGNAPVAVTVDYQEDSEHVAAVLAEIAQEMRKEEAFAVGMLSDLQLWGVDRVDGATMTLAGQIACTDSARWGVQREFNRRVKIAFQKAGIRMLPPNITVTALQRPLEIKIERPEAAKQPATSGARAMAQADAGNG